MDWINIANEAIKALIIGTITIEIIPIKISPLAFIGKRLNKDLNEKVDNLSKRVDNMEYKEDMKELRTIMSRIHSYGMLLKKGEEIPYETLKSAMRDLDKYKEYKDTYKYQIINGEKIPINGELDVDKQLIIDAMKNAK